MIIAVVGLGSMGKRRIRLLKKYNKDFEIIGIDKKEDRRKEAEELYNIKTCSDISENLNIKCCFVCTSPISHSKIITECLLKNINVFTEINLISDSYEENIKLAKERGLVLFISSTFLYRDEINKINEFIQNSNCKVNYTYHVGQYLPDWHPWESYKDFFVFDKRTNACREIFAIEMPWITKVFGKVKNIQKVKNKISNLEVPYDDSYLVILEHESGAKGTLTVDVVSRKAVRNLEVFGENIFLKWDGSPTGLFEYDFVNKKENNINLYTEIDKLENYSSTIIENAYFNEIVEFFNVFENKKIPIYTFEDDLDVLKVIDKIEE